MTHTEKVQTLCVAIHSVYEKGFLQQSVMGCGSTYPTMMHQHRYVQDVPSSTVQQKLLCRAANVAIMVLDNV